MSIDDRRVVVTGIGALSPLGNDVNSTWNNAVKGVSGAVPITKFDTTNFKTKFACELKGFDPTVRLDRKTIKTTDTYTQYGLYVSDEAIEDSKLDLSQIDPFDIGVVWGTGQAGMMTFEQEMRSYVEGGNVPRFNPYFIPKILSNMAAGLISMRHKLMGVSYTAVSACATANTAFMDAYHLIKLGKAKVMLAGGSESPISEASIGGFNALKALSTNNDNYREASKPFDENRDGFVMGEGAAALVLEDYDHAIARGAKIYAEVSGIAMTSDAYHITATHPEGIGAYESMKRALNEGGLTMADVDYVNAHATSTPVGDLSELEALSKHVAEDSKTHVSGTKSMTGHLLGAAGAIEAIFCLKAMEDHVIPPTINTKDIDERTPSNVNLVIGNALNKEVKVSLSNSFGFGGHNSTIVFKKV